MSKKDNTKLFIAAAVGATVSIGLVAYWWSRRKPSLEDLDDLPKKKKAADPDPTPLRTNRSSTTNNTVATADSTTLSDEALHKQIEELDKTGKAFYKDKQVGSFYCLVQDTIPNSHVSSP